MSIRGTGRLEHGNPSFLIEVNKGDSTYTESHISKDISTQLAEAYINFNHLLALSGADVPSGPQHRGRVSILSPLRALRRASGD